MPFPYYNRLRRNLTTYLSPDWTYCNGWARSPRRKSIEFSRVLVVALPKVLHKLDGIECYNSPIGIETPQAVDMELDGWRFHPLPMMCKKGWEHNSGKCAYRSNWAGSRLDPTRRKTYMWLVLDCDTFRASLWNTNIVVFPRRKTLKSLVSLLLLWYNNNIRRTH